MIKSLTTHQGRPLWVTERSLTELANVESEAFNGFEENNRGQCERVARNTNDRSDIKQRGGLRSMAEASKILTEGWQEGTKRLARMAEAVGDAPAIRARKRKPCYGGEGDTLVLDRALRGDWDQAWRTAKRQTSTGSVGIDLIVTWGGNWSRSAEDLFWSGAAAVVACDMLENAGYTVRLIAILPILAEDGGRGYSLDKIVIKGEDEPLRIDGAAGVLCHAGIFRTLGFMAAYRAPWAGHIGIGQMGTADAFPTEAISTDPHILVNSCYDQASAIYEVKRVLSEVQQ